MDVSDSKSVSTHSHGSLHQISETGEAVRFDTNEKTQHSTKAKEPRQKTGPTAYLKPIPPDVDSTSDARLRRKSDNLNRSPDKTFNTRKISEPVRSTRKISDAQDKMGGRSPPPRTGGPFFPAQTTPHSQLRRGSEMPGGQSGIVIPTGWDIHGRRSSQQSWPVNSRRLTQMMHRSGFLSQLLAGRFRDDRSGSLRSSDQQSLRSRVQLENTYKTEPDRQFEAHVVQKIIKNVLEKYLQKQEYCGPLTGQKARTLADMIKEKVKLEHYDRYKIVSWVAIGQKGCNDIRIASKGLWDGQNDTFAEAVYENNSLYAIGICYGIYQE